MDDRTTVINRVIFILLPLLCCHFLQPNMANDAWIVLIGLKGSQRILFLFEDNRKADAIAIIFFSALLFFVALLESIRKQHTIMNTNIWCFLFALWCPAEAFALIPRIFKSPPFARRYLSIACFSSVAPSSDDQSVCQWTLEEDWALLDQLPKFTVGEGDQARTFWTQLCAATPRLASKDVNDLVDRCQVLQTNYTLKFGHSPPLLQKWDMDISPSSRDNRAVGTLEDGRVVFLNYHLVGRLPGDILSDAASPSVMALIPGGYLEAVGGRIYELGEPRQLATKNVGADEIRAVGANHHYRHSAEFHDSIGSSVPAQSNPSKDLAWWVPGATGTVSAILASTVLSACIGYGAGLGSAVPSTPARQSIPTRSPISSAHADLQILHYKSASAYGSPSLEERKARAEYRVLREQRMIENILEQLERDQLDLHGLQKIEWMEQQQQVGTTSSNLLP